MATGYKKGGVDLDTLFWPLTTAAGPVTGYKQAGTDLNQSFEPYAHGTKQPATGYKVNGTDFADLFQNASVDPTQIGDDWPREQGISDFAISPTTAIAYIEFYSDGTFRTYRKESGGFSAYFNYLTIPGAGKGANYYIKYTSDGTENYNTAISAGAGYVDLSVTRRIGQRQLGIGIQGSNIQIYIAESSGGAGEVVAPTIGTLLLQAETEEGGGG